MYKEYQVCDKKRKQIQTFLDKVLQFVLQELSAQENVEVIFPSF
jgi:hypothetical protein